LLKTLQNDGNEQVQEDERNDQEVGHKEEVTRLRCATALRLKAAILVGLEIEIAIITLEYD
jgi:hypothetical protein